MTVRKRTALSNFDRTLSRLLNLALLLIGGNIHFNLGPSTSQKNTSFLLHFHLWSRIEVRAAHPMQ